MPSATDPIVTSDDLVSYQSGDPDLLVQIASDAVRAYCHWHIWPQITEHKNLQGTGGMVLPLPTLQAKAVSNVIVDGQSWDVNHYDCLPAPANQLRARSMFHDLGGYIDYVESWSDEWRWGYNRFPKGRPVTLDLTHGYDDVPPGLKVVVLNVASRAAGMPSTWLRAMSSDTYRYEFMSRASGTAGVAIPSIGGIQLTEDDVNQMTAFWMPGMA